MPFSDLLEKCIHVTFLQPQFRKDTWTCLVELCYKCIIVVYCDGVFRIVEGIHERQDVAAEKHRKMSSD